VFQKDKFESLPLKQQHKKAAELLRSHYTRPHADTFKNYLEMALWLSLEPISETYEALSNRYHLHLKLADQSLAEHNLLTRRNDYLSGAPFGPHVIHLDNLRSAFNVGSILRTVEAFRFGSISYGGNTPKNDNPKVQKTSMGCADLVPTATTLPRPYIALETAKTATPIESFKWPDAFTLIVGNEEYGVSEEWLSRADAIVTIPLFGGKGSLNVASATAIALSRACLHED